MGYVVQQLALRADQLLQAGGHRVEVAAEIGDLVGAGRSAVARTSSLPSAAAANATQVADRPDEIPGQQAAEAQTRERTGYDQQPWCRMSGAEPPA